MGRLLTSLGVLALLAAPARSQTVCAIQGSGETSPLLGTRVTATAVVTADFTGTELSGFFVQDPVCDADPATSEGIFVHVAVPGISVTVGHRVAVSGRVVETAGETRIEADGVRSEGPFAGGVELVGLDPPADPAGAASYLEAREGMLVSLPAQRVVGATNDRGVSYLMPAASGVERLYPGGEDGRKIALSAPGRWLGLDHGDRLTGTVGCLRFADAEYSLVVPTGRSPTVQASAAQPQAGSPDGSPRLAAYDLQDLFDASDDPATSDTVETASEYALGLARRARSIATGLGSPDVVAVPGVESESVLGELGAQPELAAAGYRAILVEGPDPRGLDVGLLVRSDRMRVLASESRPACTDLAGTSMQPCEASGGAYALFDRPPLVARLESVATGRRLSVVAGYFAPAQEGPLDEPLRLAMAQHVRGLVDELLASEPDTPVVVLGNLNDLPDSATLQALTGDGRLVDASSVPGAYTSLDRGVSMCLDYVLLDSRLAGAVAAAGPVHNNVDFAVPPPGTDSQRASDHDPVLVGLVP